ncbi:4Fe-4S dicluster domain protein [Mycobacterium kansasii]|uniref:4Fe-4S dicluster domain protein n=1 Tax=Mycobacterium kansasii TaxID=1768 RepID=A0A1V3WFY6_MYCKA|nr:4Fe-4S dicluster domain protein [Mycobacterium kansasii]
MDVRLREADHRPAGRADAGGAAAQPDQRQADEGVVVGELGRRPWGSPEIVPGDPVLQQVSERVRLELEQAFMFYLPRICEHCLNPSCVASCPSGAMYKRTEDGIVLVDQDRCRGWRMCVSGCPYKKVYFNHKTGKAEKCTMCYPRIEVGLPTVCSETCVGRLRYLGLVLYDVDRVLEAASVERDADLYPAHRRILLNPNDPDVIAGARAEGIPDEWIEAAQRSPVYALINTYQVALPLHPEFRTVPMVWYIPPLSPVVDAIGRDGHDGEDLGNLFGALGHCAFRSSTSRGCSPPATQPWWNPCCAGWRRCVPICAISTSAGRRSRISRNRSA